MIKSRLTDWEGNDYALMWTTQHNLHGEMMMAVVVSPAGQAHQNKYEQYNIEISKNNIENIYIFYKKQTYLPRPRTRQGREKGRERGTLIKPKAHSRVSLRAKAKNYKLNSINNLT